MVSIFLTPLFPTPIIDLFEPDYYRAANPDLAGKSIQEARDHFERFGLREGRKFSPIFDLQFYRDFYPDLKNLSNQQLYQHFRTSGIREGRLPSAFFNPDYYISNNPDIILNPQANLRTQRVQAIEHYFIYGLLEGRQPSEFFDANFYRLNNPDLRAAGFNNKQLLQHYQIFGLAEGRRASLIFDPFYYLDTNRDLKARGFDNRQAFEHYVTIGQAEGRRPSLFFDPEAIASLIWLTPAPGETEQTTGETQQIEREPLAKRWKLLPGGTLTYSFVTTASAPLYPGSESGVGEVSEAIKNNVRQIMQKYNEILPFNLVEVPDRPPSEGQIRILFSDGPNYAYTYEPGDGIGGDIHLSRAYESNPALSFASGPGSYGYESLIHEIGHALGLKHPNNYQGFNLNDEQQASADTGPFLPFPKDNNTNTVMSYNFAGVGASTPMPYDIRSLQVLYGTNDFNITNTTYKFDSSTFLQVKQTIWDSGGIDTFDFSDLPGTTSYFFDMNEGGRNTTTAAINGTTFIAFGDPSGKTYTADLYVTAIAYGTIIENLIGTPGNDGILGNNEANRIIGGNGADVITGARGADVLTGGAGKDIFVYAPGDGGMTQAMADIITDFTVGEDIIALAAGLRFQDLQIEAVGADSLIRIAATGEILATLIGVEPLALTSADFTVF